MKGCVGDGRGVSYQPRKAKASATPPGKSRSEAETHCREEVADIGKYAKGGDQKKKFTGSGWKEQDTGKSGKVVQFSRAEVNQELKERGMKRQTAVTRIFDMLGGEFVNSKIIY